MTGINFLNMLIALKSKKEKDEQYHRQMGTIYEHVIHREEKIQMAKQHEKMFDLNYNKRKVKPTTRYCFYLSDG